MFVLSGGGSVLVQVGEHVRNLGGGANNDRLLQVTSLINTPYILTRPFLLTYPRTHTNYVLSHSRFLSHTISPPVSIPSHTLSHIPTQSLTSGGLGLVAVTKPGKCISPRPTKPPLTLSPR